MPDPSAVREIANVVVRARTARAELAARQQEIHELSQILTAAVLELRKTMGTQEVAEAIGVSQPRVSQIANRDFHKERSRRHRELLKEAM